MKYFPRYFCILICVFSMVAGCSKFEGEKPDSPVIAEVDKSPITENDFVREVSRVPEWARSQFSGDEGKDKFLDELIKRELIYDYAKKMRLQNDEEYHDKVREFEKMTLVSMVLKKEVEDKALVDDAEVRAFFDQNADKFTVGTELRASHILVGTEEEAKDIYDKLQKGESFSKLAKMYSKDKGSAEKGGDLGYFGSGKMVPEFERAAASLKPGEVSEPVRTRFGYHIIKLTDIKKGEPAKFDQAKESIKRQLIADKRKKLFDAFVDKLKADSNITKDKNTLNAMALPWEKAGEPGSGPSPQGEQSGGTPDK